MVLRAGKPLILEPPNLWENGGSAGTKKRGDLTTKDSKYTKKDKEVFL